MRRLSPVMLPLLVVLLGCRGTAVPVRGDLPGVWDACARVAEDAGYGIVDPRADGRWPERGLMELSHRERFLGGERLSLRIPAIHPQAVIGREIRLQVREEDLLRFIFTLGLAGNRRREDREVELAGRIRAACVPPPE